MEMYCITSKLLRARLCKKADLLIWISLFLTRGVVFLVGRSSLGHLVLRNCGY